VGSAQGADNVTTCTACKAGTWSVSSGAQSEASCFPCNRGYYADTVGASKLSDCLQCPPGTWNNFIGASTRSDCKNCGAGRYQPTTGAGDSSNCLQCSAGMFSNSQGNSLCDPCPAGRWTSRTGSTLCSQCPLGRWSLVAASKPDDCINCNGVCNLTSTTMGSHGDNTPMSTTSSRASSETVFTTTTGRIELPNAAAFHLWGTFLVIICIPVIFGCWKLGRIAWPRGSHVYTEAETSRAESVPPVTLQVLTCDEFARVVRPSLGLRPSMARPI